MDKMFLSTTALLDLAKIYIVDISLSDEEGNFRTGLSLGVEKSGRYPFKSFDGKTYQVTASEFFRIFPYVIDNVWRIDKKMEPSNRFKKFLIGVYSRLISALYFSLLTYFI